MDVLQIAGIGIIAAVLAVTIKSWRPDIAILVSIGAGVILFLGMADSLSKIFQDLDNIVRKSGIRFEYIKIVIKLTGIAYITKFASEICSDCGEKAIAVKVELAGKAAVMLITIPVIDNFLNMVIAMLDAF